MRDPLARALKNDNPESFAERLAVALVQVKPPVPIPGKSGRPWQRVGWLAEQGGFKRQLVYCWLSGICEPRLRHARRLARVLGVNPGWLCFGVPPVRIRGPVR